MKPELPLIDRRAWPLRRVRASKSLNLRPDVHAEYLAMSKRWGYTLEALVDKALRYWITNVRSR